MAATFQLKASIPTQILLLSYYLTPSIYASITDIQTSCTNYAQCIQQHTNSTYIDCSGDLSCEASTLHSMDSYLNQGDGYINCAGDGSCKRSGLSSTNVIKCAAHESCYFPDYIIAQNDITCSGDHSCFSNEFVSNDPHIKSITGNVICEGSGSCLDAKIESGNHAYCTAHESCATTTISTGGNIYCDGNLACKESTISAMGDIYCSGTQSCNLAVSITGDSVYAYGYSTAFKSKINARIIKAFGHYGISYSTVDSVNQEEMKVFSYGFNSGYGASVICRAGSKCILKCKTSGCKGLDYICLNGADCTITPHGCMSIDTDNPTDSNTIIKGTDCPNWSSSTSTEEDEQLLSYVTEKEESSTGVDQNENEDGIDLEFDVEIEEYYLNDDAIVEDVDVVADGMMVRFSEYQQCMNEQYIGDGYTLYCSGEESCVNAELGNLPGNTGSSISCNGELSCNKASLSGAGDIRCGGYQSCNHANGIMGYDGSSRVECYGSESCLKVSETGRKDGGITGNEIECHGSLACKLSKISSQDYVQCGGSSSCLQADITSDEGVIFCGGSSACENTKLVATQKNVICSGKTSCQNSEIEGNLIHIGGEQGAIWGKIKGNMIQAFGYKSIEFATIDSEGQNIMQVKSYGYMSGVRGTIICRSGSQCELKCESRGCFRLEIYCLHGSFCSITPIQCKQDNSDGKVTKGIDCPTIKKSMSADEDKHLLKSISKRQKYHETLFKLNEHNRRQGQSQLKHMDKTSEELIAMVMENEIGLPRHYHRLHLYVAIAVIGILMLCIPAFCLINNLIFGDDKEKELMEKIEEEKLMAAGSRSWPLLIRKKQYQAI